MNNKVFFCHNVHLTVHHLLSQEHPIRLDLLIAVHETYTFVANIRVNADLHALVGSENK